jgi:hypothetical protein
MQLSILTLTPTMELHYQLPCIIWNYLQYAVLLNTPGLPSSCLELSNSWIVLYWTHLIHSSQIE